MQLSEWLAEQGYQISKSSVGFYSQKLQAEMDKSLGRARERMAIAKAFKSASDEDKAALMEAKMFSNLLTYKNQKLIKS